MYDELLRVKINLVLIGQYFTVLTIYEFIEFTSVIKVSTSEYTLFYFIYTTVNELRKIYYNAFNCQL